MVTVFPTSPLNTGLTGVSPGYGEAHGQVWPLWDKTNLWRVGQWGQELPPVTVVLGSVEGGNKTEYTEALVGW